MKFSFIYIDDYGNTGNRMDDPDQPIFMLTGLVVPSDNLNRLEYEVMKATLELRDLADKPAEKMFEYPDFELHGQDLFSRRNKALSGVPIEARTEMVLRLAKVTVRLGGKIVSTFVDKAKLLQAREDLVDSHVSEDIENAKSELKERGIPYDDDKLAKVYQETHRQTYTPYVVGYSTLLVPLNDLLQKQNRFGVLIVDQQNQFKSVHYLNSTRALRLSAQKDKTLTFARIIEQPLQGDGKSNPLLQLADVFGYIVGRQIKAEMQGRSAHDMYQPVLDILDRVSSIKNAEGYWQDKRVHAVSEDLAQHILKHKMPAIISIGMTKEIVEGLDFQRKGEEH